MAGTRKIGWYVHYTASGYETHGVSVNRNTDRRPSLDEASNLAHNQIKSRASFFSNTLTKDQANFLSKTLSLSKKTPDERDWLANKITAQLQELHGDAMNKIRINFETGQVASQQDWITLLQIDNKLTLEKIGLKLQKLQNNIDKYINFLDKEGAGAAKNGLKNLQREYDLIQSDINRTAGNDKIMVELAKKINDFVVTNDFNMPAINLIKGDLMECLYLQMPEFISNFCENAAINAIPIDLKKDWVGRNTIQRKIETSDFVKSTFSSDEKQGKVDAIITLADMPGNTSGLGTRLRASIKNYTLKNSKRQRWISLGSAPLSYILQEVNHDFVNHFLNIYSKHYKEGGKRSPKNINIDASSRANFKATLIYCLLYGALTGQNAGKLTMDEIVGTLVINDASRGVAKVWTVEEFLKFVERYLKWSGDQTAGSIVSVNFGESKTLGKINTLFSNDWVEGDSRSSSLARQRIAKILSQLHGIHVAVSVNPHVIKGQIT